MIQYLQQQINEINEKLSKSQNNQVHRSLDILFLIGMPKKDNQHDVSCEKEIMKIQTILYQNKIKCSISIAKTKESFQEMLSLNPQIIHVICHGQKPDDTQNRTTFNLEIEDQKGEQQAITGQKFMKWIRKSNCNPCLIILNACYSQGIYEDMLRVQNNKLFNTLAINSEFQINDKFAYKFVMLFYRKFISEMKQNNSKILDKKNTTNQKENKIPWLKIIEDTKQYINRNQLQEMVHLKSLCCKDSNCCEFLQQNKNYQNCGCFKEQSNINFEDYQAKHQNLMKGLTNQEFNYLKQFVQLHNESCQNYKIGKNLINNRKYSFQLCTRGIQKLFKELKKSQIWKRFLTSIEKSDQSQEAIFLIAMNFLKQMFLEGERFIFNQQKNSSNPMFAFQDHKYQQIVLHGPDFLTNNYPKLSRSKDISDIEKIFKKSIKKSQKDFSLNLNYYEQSKGKVLKYLTDIQSKSADYKSQIHILNISGINTVQEFQRIFLLDFKSIQKNIQGQNQIDDNQINLFYLYNWKKSDQQLNLIKGKQENIQLYIQSEQENDYDSLLFYSFTIKDINHLIKNLPKDEIETIMHKFKLNQKQVIEYLKYCQNLQKNNNHKDYYQTDQLFKELIKQKSSQGIQTVDCMFQYTIEQINNLFAQKNNESLTNIEIDDKSETQTILNNTQIQQQQTKSFEDMNRFLLNLIDPEEFVQNKQLYKYLLKNIMINCTNCLKIIKKKSLTKCLLKQILQNCFISQEKLKFLYQNQQNQKKQINIQSLKGILNFFKIEYSEIVPQLRDVAKYIILNEQLPLDIMLVKSYIVEIDFENKFHKEFRDIIKIHKRILIEKKKFNEQEIRDLEEVEYILDYLKVKYYNKIARINRKNQNLYYLSTMNAEINSKSSSRLLMMILSRNIIRTISYIDFQKSSLNDIDCILNLHLKFQNYFTQISQKKQRQQFKQSPKNQKLNFNKEFTDILIQSTLLKELFQFLNKAQKSERNYLKQIQENLSISNDRQKGLNIIKNSVQKLRTMYREFQNKYSDNFSKFDSEKQQIQISFSAYYELELLIEQVFHEMKNNNLTNQIIQFSNIQLNCQEFYQIFKNLNENQIQNVKINQNLIHNFHDSFLFIQYYFKCPKESSHTLINKSLSIKKNITENIYNRLIFTTKLFTKSNIQQIQKIQEFQKLKKIIIIDQNETNHFDKYDILDLENLNTQKNQPTLKYAQQVELLIILNSSESYDLQQSVFKEKWVLCINKQNMNIHEQHNFLMSLLQNIIKSDKVNFPLALQKSLSSIIKEDLSNQISFKCFSKENIEISNLCYSNNDKSLNEYSAIEDITQQEDINNYLETQKSHSQVDLLDIFGKQANQQTINFTITDTTFSNNFQELSNMQSIELQNPDSFPNTFPQSSQLENNLQYSHQNDEEDEDEDDTIYSSQLQTEKNIFSYTKDKKY